MNNLIIIFIIFIIGLIFYCSNSRTKTFENFENNSPKDGNVSKQSIKNKLNLPCGAKIPKDNCPNVLMKKDNKIYLYNSNLARVPGINPVIFNTLEDYAEFVEWQKSQNIDCPVLFLDTTFDTQNNEVYKVTSNPFSQPDIVLQTDLARPGNGYITPLMNANRRPDIAPYNQGSMIPADYDPNNQYIGLITPLDKMFVSKQNPSPNPMDPNWGGHSFTQSKIDDGLYDGDVVTGVGVNRYSGINIASVGNPQGTSDSAMDDDWKGEVKTSKDIQEGKFDGSKVTKSGINKIQNPNLLY